MEKFAILCEVIERLSGQELLGSVSLAASLLRQVQASTRDIDPIVYNNLSVAADATVF
jgi:hypothetical protein